MKQDKLTTQKTTQWLAANWDVLILFGIGLMMLVTCLMSFFLESVELDGERMKSLFLAFIVASVGSGVRQELGARRHERTSREENAALLRQMLALTRRVRELEQRHTERVAECERRIQTRIDALEHSVSRRMRAIEEAAARPRWPVIHWPRAGIKPRRAANG